MKYKRKVLPNGLRIITVNMKDTPTVTVLVMVEAGSEYETKNKSGISHFLEHMCFKGTEKYPTALDISKELDAIGAYYNAFTSEEYTGYYAKSAPKHIHKILDVVSDLFLNPTFPEKEIEKEKGVIVEEINMYKDVPQRHVQEVFSELLYGDQPAGWNIAGTRETVNAIVREDFTEYKDRHYVAKGTTILVAGNFNEKAVEKDILEKFKNIPSSKKHSKPKVIENQEAPAIRIEDRKTDQTHVVFGVRGFPIKSKDTPAARLMTAILGAGMSSRLFQKLREEMGVGYYVRASYDTGADHGVFSVSVGCDVKRVPEVVSAIVSELNKMKDEKVSPEELTKTQDYIIGTMFLGLESSDAVAEFYGYQEILRRELRMPDDVVMEIKKVTAKDIRNVAKKLFVDKNINLAAIGPIKDEAGLRKLLKFNP